MIMERIFLVVNKVLWWGEADRSIPSAKPALDEARARLIATGMTPASRGGFGWLSWGLLALCLAAIGWAVWMLLRKKQDS